MAQVLSTSHLTEKFHSSGLLSDEIFINIIPNVLKFVDFSQPKFELFKDIKSSNKSSILESNISVEVAHCSRVPFANYKISIPNGEFLNFYVQINTSRIVLVYDISGFKDSLSDIQITDYKMDLEFNVLKFFRSIGYDCSFNRDDLKIVATLDSNSNKSFDLIGNFNDIHFVVNDISLLTRAIFKVNSKHLF